MYPSDVQFYVLQQIQIVVFIVLGVSDKDDKKDLNVPDVSQNNFLLVPYITNKINY